MTKAGDCFVYFCSKLHNTPAAAMCVVVFLAQTAAMDYYLVLYLSYDHLYWVASDMLNLALLVSCIYQSYSGRSKKNANKKTAHSFAWLSWLVMNIVLSAKTIVVFLNVAHTLEEKHPSFFGPNTLKTTIALGSCVFLLLLTTQHDAPLGSERRQFINELTGTVVFDLLDTADILEILFEENETESFWTGLKEFILAVGVLNLVIPTVPLLTLSITNFGRDKLQRRLMYLHRMLVVLAVNVPNLLVRLNLWHGHSVAISPFTLKNIILICITVYEFYLHKRGKYEGHKRERKRQKNIRDNGINPTDIFTVNIPDANSNHKSIDDNFDMEQRVVTSE
ncbi:unnamed protein product [Candidula unifasciata]|uniref:Uncharacterized protein n=1 Tax=Candidula unifasciata TaxID=100452 RepID=A0A8S3YKS1_9EUPU|nr:unnamed protein product [Candidula unifasciata]